MTTDFQQPGNLGDVNSNEPGSGARYNAGKPAYELVPLIAFEGCARVFDFGRAKYAPWNWAKGMAWSAPFGCLMRHLSAWQRGEDNDPESGLPHLDHAMANLVMLTTYARTYPQGDDRTKWLRAAEAGEAEEKALRQGMRAVADDFFKQFATSDFQPAESGPVPEHPPHDPIAEGFRRKAEHAKYLARWANAPAEATHLAEDPDAECLWFSGAPKQDSHDYWQGHFLGRAGDKLLGRVACEPRPRAEAEQTP